MESKFNINWLYHFSKLETLEIDTKVLFPEDFANLVSCIKRMHSTCFSTLIIKTLVVSDGFVNHLAEAIVSRAKKVLAEIR